jgi:hypothetical protein
MKAAGYYIDKLIKPVLTKKGIYHTKIFSEWEMIVGKHMAAISVPKKISLSKNVVMNNGSILIEVACSGVATELHYHEQIIIEKLAIYFGYRAITKVKFIINPSLKLLNIRIPLNTKKISIEQQQHIEVLTETIDDDRLKLALSELAEAIYTN